VGFICDPPIDPDARGIRGIWCKPITSASEPRSSRLSQGPSLGLQSQQYRLSDGLNLASQERAHVDTDLLSTGGLTTKEEFMPTQSAATAAASNAAIAQGSYKAYVTKDRAALKSLLAEDFYFTSPLDNRLDRGIYFRRCWPNSEAIEAFEFVHVVSDDDRVFVTYEGRNKRPCMTFDDEFSRETIDVEAGRVFVRRGGSGPVVLLLHGYPETGLAWRRVAPALANEVHGRHRGSARLRRVDAFKRGDR
jgi:ketosteroid isomerase-like protein